MIKWGEGAKVPTKPTIVKNGSKKRVKEIV